MRALVLRELEFVAGGDLEEVVVEERRLPVRNLPMWDGCNINAADIYYGENVLGDLDEVVVEASRDSKDHCNLSPDLAPESCKQHDKDYSEDSKLDRKEADERFLENMKKELAERYPDLPQAVREAIANGYYKAVREFGHLYYKGQGVNDRVVREGDDIPRIPRF